MSMMSEIEILYDMIGYLENKRKERGLTELEEKELHKFRQELRQWWDKRLLDENGKPIPFDQFRQGNKGKP